MAVPTDRRRCLLGVGALLVEADVVTARHSTRRARRLLRHAGHPELQHLIGLGSRDQSFHLIEHWQWSAVVTAIGILASSFPEEVCVECLANPAYRAYYEGVRHVRPTCTHKVERTS